MTRTGSAGMTCEIVKTSAISPSSVGTSQIRREKMIARRFMAAEYPLPRRCAAREGIRLLYLK
jgi:hypothetical protein